MKTRRMARVRNQTLLFVALTIFTFMNLIPLIWAALTSIKNAGAASTIPPTIFFQPTFEYHRQVWLDRGFAHYLINSLIVSAGTVFIWVSIGSLAAYGLSRMPHSAAPPPSCSGCSRSACFLNMLLAIPFFVMGSFLSTDPHLSAPHPGACGDQPAIHDLADVQFLPLYLLGTSTPKLPP